MLIKRIWPILKGTFAEFSEDNVLRLSAALAYYAMFSLGPLLIIAVSLAGFAFGHDTVRHEINRQLTSAVGPQATETINSMMATQRHSNNWLGAVLGVVILFVSATGVFGQLQDALNIIWNVQAKPGLGLWSFIRARLLSLAMVLGTGFLLLISMVLTTVLTALGNSLGTQTSLTYLIKWITTVVSFGVITLLFALIFKLVPDVKIPLRKALAGAAGTAALFVLGKYVLALYLSRTATTSTYGAAGSAMVILLWVYYASVILFLGAEFTQVYTRETTGKVVAAEHAIPATNPNS